MPMTLDFLGNHCHSEAFGSTMCQMAFRHGRLICTIKQNNSVLVCTSRHDDHLLLFCFFFLLFLDMTRTMANVP
jgi:hypothetical protein